MAAKTRRPGGWFELPKLVVDSLVRVPGLSAIDLKVALVVGRWTYGHRADSHVAAGNHLAQSFIASECGCGARSVKRSLRKLTALGIVIEVAPNHGGRSARLKLQSDVRKWVGCAPQDLLTCWVATAGVEELEAAIEIAGRPRTRLSDRSARSDNVIDIARGQIGPHDGDKAVTMPRPSWGQICPPKSSSENDSEETQTPRRESGRLCLDSPSETALSSAAAAPVSPAEAMKQAEEADFYCEYPDCLPPADRRTVTEIGTRASRKGA